MIAEVQKGLSDHLQDCYKVRVEQNAKLDAQDLKLDSIKEHLDAQDDDIQLIRDIRRIAGWGMGFLVLTEVLFNIYRAATGH